MLARVGEAAGLDVRAHPHMLRHACGYHLANKGKDTRSLQGYLGHVDIRHTAEYSMLAPTGLRTSGRISRAVGLTYLIGSGPYIGGCQKAGGVHPLERQ